MNKTEQISPTEAGFQFPGYFELSALGASEENLDKVLPELLLSMGVTVPADGVQSKASSGGNYISVRIRFYAETREQYDAAHQALRDHPHVKWTL